MSSEPSSETLLKGHFSQLREWDRRDCPPVEPMLARARSAETRSSTKDHDYSPWRWAWVGLIPAAACAVWLMSRFQFEPRDLSFVEASPLLSPKVAKTAWLEVPTALSSPKANLAWMPSPSASLLPGPQFSVFPSQ